MASKISQLKVASFPCSLPHSLSGSNTRSTAFQAINHLKKKVSGAKNQDGPVTLLQQTPELLETSLQQTGNMQFQVEQPRLKLICSKLELNTTHIIVPHTSELSSIAKMRRSIRS
eukprot:3408795-Rhodomonas_salina.1